MGRKSIAAKVLENASQELQSQDLTATTTVSTFMTGADLYKAFLSCLTHGKNFSRYKSNATQICLAIAKHPSLTPSLVDTFICDWIDNSIIEAVAESINEGILAASCMDFTFAEELFKPLTQDKIHPNWVSFAVRFLPDNYLLHMFNKSYFPDYWSRGRKDWLKTSYSSLFTKLSSRLKTLSTDTTLELTRIFHRRYLSTDPDIKPGYQGEETDIKFKSLKYPNNYVPLSELTSERLQELTEILTNDSGRLLKENHNEIRQMLVNIYKKLVDTLT